MKISSVIKNSLLVIFGLLWLVPVYLVIVNAIKAPLDYLTSSPWAMPQGFDLFENVTKAIQRAHFNSSIAPTFLYAIVAPAVAALLGAMIGYAIVALKLNHGFFWFCLIFGGTVIPVQMVLMPLFVGYASTGLYDTWLGMILAYVAMTLPFCAFVMRNFFTGIADQVFEAATVDGASTIRIFFQIYLPMARPALVAVFILQAVAVWNELLVAMTLSQSDNVRTLMPALSSLNGAYGGSAATVVLAGGLLVSIPTVLLFLFTQRFFQKGLALGQY